MRGLRLAYERGANGYDEQHNRNDVDHGDGRRIDMGSQHRPRVGLGSRLSTSWNGEKKSRPKQ